MHGAVLLLFQCLHLPWKNTYHLIQFVRSLELRVVGLNVSTFYKSYFYLNQAVIHKNIVINIILIFFLIIDLIKIKTKSYR